LTVPSSELVALDYFAIAGEVIEALASDNGGKIP
jgi:hypothetical protein